GTEWIRGILLFLLSETGLTLNLPGSKDGFEFFLPPSPECWNYKCAPPRLASKGLLEKERREGQRLWAALHLNRTENQVHSGAVPCTDTYVHQAPSRDEPADRWEAQRTQGILNMRSISTGWQRPRESVC
ncbi:hypothetical protein LEMLEM_LOCUS25118, partial [Lemmus lemmus]